MDAFIEMTLLLPSRFRGTGEALRQGTVSTPCLPPPPPPPRCFAALPCAGYRRASIPCYDVCTDGLNLCGFYGAVHEFSSWPGLLYFSE